MAAHICRYPGQSSSGRHPCHAVQKLCRAAVLLSRFTEGDIDQAEMTELARQTYAGFTHPDVAPLKPVSDNLHVLELFYGPTITFKDYAMQFLSRAFDRALTARTGLRSFWGPPAGIQVQPRWKRSKDVLLWMCSSCFLTGASLR